MKNKWYRVLITCLFLAGAFLRLYHFPERLIFGPEQAISLLTSASNLQKFSLLGEFNLQRTTSTGLNLIHGPLFSYFLLPFIVIFNFRVLPISLVFPFLNLFTALVLLTISWKIFGKAVALFSTFFFLFSALMIYHSLFIWIYNPTPLLGILTVWFLSRLILKNKKVGPSFWLGIISGIGFSLQYPFLIFAVFVFLLIHIISRNRIKSSLVYIFGFFIANITKVIFDLRHDFYHARVLWQFLGDVYIRHTVSASTYDYSYLHLFPIFCLLLALIAVGLFRVNKWMAIGMALIYIVINVNLPIFSLKNSIGMPNGITLNTLENVANTISSDNPPKNFNVVTLWDFDTIARPMRYLLQYNHGLVPQPLDNYANVSAVYAYAPKTYDIYHPAVWELKSFEPYKVSILPSPSDQYVLYKLEK